MSNRYEIDTINNNGGEHFDAVLEADFKMIQNNAFKRIKQLAENGNYKKNGWRADDYDELLERLVMSANTHISKRVRQMVYEYFDEIKLKDDSGQKRKMLPQEADLIIRQVFDYLNQAIENKEI